MKVFGCTMQGCYCGGIILVAANTKEEAVQIASTNPGIDYWFEWIDEYGGWAEPFSEGARLTSSSFPPSCWREYEHLASDHTEPQVILAEFHAE